MLALMVMAAAPFELVLLITSVAAVLQAFLAFFLKQRQAKRLGHEGESVEVTLKVGDTKETFDLNDPEQAAEYLAALEQTRAAELLVRGRGLRRTVHDAETRT
jgi:hypothetical protein